MGKRIMIVGAGALGAYAGGYMARAGNDVIMFDAWPRHVDKMNADGLTLEGLTEPECFTAPVRAMHLTDLQGLTREDPIDIAIVAVKSYDTPWATMLVKDYLAPDGFVVSLQNCLNEEVIAGIVGWGRVMGCIANKIGVELVGPAHVRRGVPLGGAKHVVFRVGEAHGRVSRRAALLRDLLAEVDSAIVTTNLWGERWSKLVTNAMRNGVVAASGMDSNECDLEPVTRTLAIRIGGEGVKVGQALGFDLEPINGFAPERWVAALEGDKAAGAEIERWMIDSVRFRRAGMRPSMGQDMMKGRRTEIDMINGAIAAKGADIGLPAPANAGLVAAVKRVEYGQAPASLENVKGI